MKGRSLVAAAAGWFLVAGCATGAGNGTSRDVGAQQRERSVESEAAEEARPDPYRRGFVDGYERGLRDGMDEASREQKADDSDFESVPLEDEEMGELEAWPGDGSAGEAPEPTLSPAPPGAGDLPDEESLQDSDTGTSPSAPDQGRAAEPGTGGVPPSID